MNEQKIPQGYKQTEVGVIPEDWDCVKLSEIVKQARLPSGIYKDKALYGNGTKIIKLGDVFNFDEFRPDLAQRVLLSEDEKISYRVNIGDIFIALASVKLEGVGKVMLVTNLDEPTSFDHNVALIRPINEVNSKFIFYLLKSNLVRILVGKNATQVGTTFLKASIILGFPLFLPPIKEQTLIATALSDVDALICELEKIISKKQAIKTATMQQLLTGKTRLPQFALCEDGTKKGFKQSELGEIPKDWGVKTVYELAEKQKSQFDDGDWVEAEHITDRGIRLIQTGNIGIGQYVEKDTKKYIYPTSFEKLKCKELQKGDLLICRLAEPAGRACIFYNIGEQRVITSVDVTIFRPSSYLADRKFYVQYFSFDVWFKSVLEQVGGTTHKRISRGALGRISVPYPSIQEQTAIATILSDMDSEIQALEKRLNKTRQIKQGMMQELLTGKTRLVQPEA